jgi:hypothetical protein
MPATMVIVMVVMVGKRRRRNRGGAQCRNGCKSAAPEKL